MTLIEPIPRMDELACRDTFRLSRQDAQYNILSSVGEYENPEIVKRARQIHGMSYVEYGYFDASGQTDDGSLVDELDGTQGTQDGSRVANYLLASRFDTDPSEGTASVRLLDIGENGSIDDLPTYKYFADVFSEDVKLGLKSIVDTHGRQGLREVAALSTTDAREHRGSFELMRALVQNSMIKQDAGHPEMYLASLTDKSLRPVLQFINRDSAEILAEPVQIFSEDERSQSIYVTPVLMDLSATVRNVMRAVENATEPAKIAALESHLRFLVDGLPDGVLKRYIGD